MATENDDFIVENIPAEGAEQEPKKPSRRVNPREESIKRVARAQAEAQGYQPAVWGDDDDEKPAEKPATAKAEEPDEEDKPDDDVPADVEVTEEDGTDAAPDDDDEPEPEPEEDPEPEPEEVRPAAAAKKDDAQTELEKRLAKLEEDRNRLLESVASGQKQMQQMFLQSQQRAPQPADDDDESEPEPDYYEQLADASAAGDTELLRKLTQQHDQQMLEQTRESVRAELEGDRVTREFREQYPDIVNDKSGTLWNMANEITIQQRQQGKTLSEAADLAGKAVTQWLQDIRADAAAVPQPKAEDEPKAELDEKPVKPPKTAVTDNNGTKEKRVEKKRQTVVQLPLTSAKHERQKEEPIPTPSDIIGIMRKRRMQA